MQTNSATAELQHLLSLAVPGHAAANNPIAVAHAALQHLRESGDEHFLFLRTVLELAAQQQQQQANLSASQEELLFHCVAGCRQVFLWQWPAYSSTFLAAVCDFMSSLGGATTSRTVRLACYTTAVCFWKRRWNDGSDASVENGATAAHPREHALLQALQSVPLPNRVSLVTKHDLFNHLDQLFQQQTTQAAELTACLLGEFAGRSAVVYRLPLEFHKQAHSSFEKEGALNHCLKLSMGALSQVVQRIADQPHAINVEQALAVVQLTTDVIGWEFGLAAWDTGAVGASGIGRTILRPPVEWREYLARPDFVGACFHVHEIVASQAADTKSSRHMVTLAQNIRQVLLLLASLSGPMFVDAEQRKLYASYVLEGTLKLLQTSCNKELSEGTSSELLDTFQLISRLIVNFRLSVLVELPNLFPLLQGVTSVGTQLLTDNVKECEEARGDIECMEHREWREEALGLLLDCTVKLCGDPWLLYSGSEESRKSAQVSLSAVLGPLYEGFVRCRTRMASLEEHYLVSNEAELEEVKEEIIAIDQEEEMSSVSTLGRLNLSAAISCLSALFSQTMPQLQSLWEGNGHVTPETAALLEQSRLLTMYVAQLLTDDNSGESPAIPDAVVTACQDDKSLTGVIAPAVQALIQFADTQVHKIAENPSNVRLSPLLAKSFLWFLHRWAPAYLYPIDYASSNTTNPIITEWSSPEKAQQVISFCISLCIYYQSYWPHERQVQESAGTLLLSLAKRGGHIRSCMVSSQSFHQMVRFHCLTAGIRHCATQSEFEAAILSKAGDEGLPSMDMLWGYQSLSYDDKSRVLTALLVASSDSKDATANAMITELLKNIHDSFTSLVNALSTNQVGPDDVNAKEMASLCIEMFCGVAHASEMAEAERIPQFITPYLPQLSGLMTYYAQDLNLCESLLRFFRDYTEQFVAMLDREQSVALFNASASLLKSYSANHCKSRVVVTKRSKVETMAEEEQAYSDILCAIQLLINLGTKDFIDACSSHTKEGVDSTQVTDVIFFGLQQILPLMTQGLLQFPTLCSQFFDLVGFMMDTYPEKVCVLPFDLFDSLLESLLFGMSHHDAAVSKCSLHGIASIAMEQLRTQILAPHLQQHPDVLDKCARRLLIEVVFQSVVVDRVEASGLALLPLVAVDVNRFAATVQQIGLQIPDERQRNRLQAAFERLIQPEALAKVSAGGYEGRMNRVQFKKEFEVFVNEIHSFLVLK